jgi:hypothetical protein
MESLPFDYRRVFQAMNQNRVSYLLIGGLNYFLAFKPVTTQDIDLWIEDTPENRSACEMALAELGAEWGKRDEDWSLVNQKPSGWLTGQCVFCLLTRFGPVDIFLSVPGLPDFSRARRDATIFTIDRELSTPLISANDLLSCQLALPTIQQKQERVRTLQEFLANDN